MIAAAAVVLASGCVPAFTGNQAGPKVAVIGDSITNMSSDEFHRALDDEFAVSVDGRNSHTVAMMQESADEYARLEPDIVVINLGTNDSYAGGSLAMTAIGLMAMERKFPNSCVILTTLSTGTLSPYMNSYHAQLNQGIRNRWPSKRYIDWDAIVWDRGTVFDTIHPTRWGSRRLAEMAEDQVRGCAQDLRIPHFDEPWWMW